MVLEEKIVTQAIIDRYFEKLKRNLSVDVAVVGGGPSGLVCSYSLTKKGYRVALFERKLSIGGGMWGGGMLFPRIIIQEEAAEMVRGLPWAAVRLNTPAWYRDYRQQDYARAAYAWQAVLALDPNDAHALSGMQILPKP